MSLKIGAAISRGANVALKEGILMQTDFEERTKWATERLSEVLNLKCYRELILGIAHSRKYRTWLIYPKDCSHLIKIASAFVSVEASRLGECLSECETTKLGQALIDRHMNAYCKVERDLSDRGCITEIVLSAPEPVLRWWCDELFFSAMVHDAVTRSL